MILALHERVPEARETFVNWVTASGVVPESSANAMWDAAYNYGKVVGTLGAFEAIADHGVEGGIRLMLTALDAEAAVMGA